MDEVDNEALSVLLILDDELFPQLLEWSSSKGWSDLVIFLLETDYLRFKTNEMFESEPDKTSLYEPYHLIQKNSGGCFDKFFTPEQMKSLKRLIDSGIPLNSVYSQVCSAVWKEMLNRTDDIIHSPTWPTVRRSIVEQHEIGIEEMLADVMKRKFFDRFIQGNASDLATLQCLLSVRRIFDSLSKYKEVSSELGRNNSGNGSRAHEDNSSSNIFSFFGGSNSDDNPSMLRRWKASKNAIVSASKALQAPFSTSVHSAGAVNSTTQASAVNNNECYTDPFEAFKILLEGTRRLQKQFFPTSTNLNPSSGSAFQGSSPGYTYPTTPRSYGSYESTASREESPTMANQRSGSGSSGRPAPMARQNSNNSHMRNCSGISEALRIEIQSTLTVNASVRSREIETVDRAFAFACANILDKQLRALETEMFTYISAIFADFEHTNDYAMMVAQARAMQCKRVVDYSRKLEFLYDRVRQQKIVSWKDAQTRGKVFIAYEQLTAEGEEYGEEECKASALPESAPVSPFSHVDRSTKNLMMGTTGTEPPEPNGRFNPNVVAISLEIGK